MKDKILNTDNNEQLDLFFKDYLNFIPEVTHSEFEVDKMFDYIYSNSNLADISRSDSIFQSIITNVSTIFEGLIYRPYFKPILISATALVAICITSFFLFFKPYFYQNITNPTISNKLIEQSKDSKQIIKANKDKTSTTIASTHSKSKPNNLVKNVIRISRKNLDNMYLASLSRSVASAQESTGPENDSDRLQRAFNITNEVLKENNLTAANFGNKSIKTEWIAQHSNSNSVILARLIIEKDTSNGLQLFFIKEEKQFNKTDNQSIPQVKDIDFFEIIKQIKIKFYE